MKYIILLMALLFGGCEYEISKIDENTTVEDIKEERTFIYYGVEIGSQPDSSFGFLSTGSKGDIYYKSGFDWEYIMLTTTNTDGISSVFVSNEYTSSYYGSLAKVRYSIEFDRLNGLYDLIEEEDYCIGFGAVCELKNFVYALYTNNRVKYSVFNDDGVAIYLRMDATDTDDSTVSILYEKQ